MPIFFAGLLLAFFGMAGARADLVNFTGHYELADAHADHAFSFDVTQTGSRVTISFSAGMADGSGAAPDGDGKGTVDKTGVLTFKFKDSFDNEGTGSFARGKDGYHLSLDATTVVESRPLRFYGDVVLKKTADKPSSS